MTLKCHQLNIYTLCGDFLIFMLLIITTANMYGATVPSSFLGWNLPSAHKSGQSKQFQQSHDKQFLHCRRETDCLSVYADKKGHSCWGRRGYNIQEPAHAFKVTGSCELVDWQYPPVRGYWEARQEDYPDGLDEHQTDVVFLPIVAKLQDVKPAVSSVIRSFKYSETEVRLATPEQLQTKPDVDSLVFGKYFTDHMIKINYHSALGGWQKPQIHPVENLTLHPAAKVLHYAIELFEGMKAYRGIDDKIRMFRPDLNMKRMNATATRSGLPNFDSMEMIKILARLLQIDQEWVPHSNTASLYIRPTLIGVDPQLGMTASESALLFAICSPVNSYFKEGFTALSLLADPKYTRAWPGGCGDKKMGSNYAPTVQVQREAFDQGFQQVLWLYGDDDLVTEAGTMNIFMVIKNDEGQKELITPPLNGLILPGVTRASILDVARESRRVKVTERDMTMKEVVQLSKKGRLLEMFGAGTACIVSPVGSIGYRGEILKIPTMEHDDKEFEFYLKRLSTIQYGHIKHPWGFCIDDYCQTGT